MKEVSFTLGVKKDCALICRVAFKLIIIFEDIIGSPSWRFGVIGECFTKLKFRDAKLNYRIIILSSKSEA